MSIHDDVSGIMSLLFLSLSPAKSNWIVCGDQAGALHLFERQHERLLLFFIQLTFISTCDGRLWKILREKMVYLSLYIGIACIIVWRKSTQWLYIKNTNEKKRKKNNLRFMYISILKSNRLNMSKRNETNFAPSLPQTVCVCVRLSDSDQLAQNYIDEKVWCRATHKKREFEFLAMTIATRKWLIFLNSYQNWLFT